MSTAADLGRATRVSGGSGEGGMVVPAALGAGFARAALDELLSARRSIRGFRQEPAPRVLLERALAMAQRSPSNCNVQPWQVHLVSGAAVARMRSALYAAAVSGTDRTPDFPLTDAHPGIYRERQVSAAKALFAATGVTRHDDRARTESFLRNFRFFDAPHAAFVYLPAWAGVREAADAGMYVQSLMLALTASGLASCPQGALGHYAGTVREQLGLGSEPRLLLGLAIGYADDDHPANAASTERALPDEATFFHDN